MNPLSSVTAAASKSTPDSTPNAVRDAARGLEAFLLRQMLTEMQKAQLENGLFGDSPGSGARQTAFDLLLSEAMAETEPLGLAEQIAAELTPDQAEAIRGLDANSMIEGSLIPPPRAAQVPLAAADTYFGMSWSAPTDLHSGRRTDEDPRIGRDQPAQANPGPGR